MKSLVINLGGTSTKIGVYDDKNPIIKESIRHDTSEIKKFKQVWDQYEYRKCSILNFLKVNKINLYDIDFFVSRGPSVKPVISGTYRIDENMVTDAKNGNYGVHVCNLGSGIALEFANENNKIALTCDMPCVDEMISIAKYTGIPDIKRHSFFQALSHKAVGREVAMEIGKPYEELALVITHLGSGISVASHLDGKVIDITNGLDGDAPFGMDRSGTLPAADWKKLILSGKYSNEQLDYFLNGGGGLMAHLSTNNGEEVEKRIDAGDNKAKEVYEAMAFQISKALGAASAAMGKKPDGIIITGGLAHSKRFTDMIIERVSWISKVYVRPDTDELDALNEGTYEAFIGQREIMQY
ncbi:MAG: butyrate kinase [Lachnospiraceae bacterium]|jgi:butyrate kinase|nr:butyrate kinase [Lachnospiraceae bacterium]